MDLRRDVAREIARIYCRLSPSGIEALSEILVPFKYSKGDVVLPEGETCRHMYFVERGMVRQYYYWKTAGFTVFRMMPYRNWQTRIKRLSCCSVRLWNMP